VSEVKEIRKAAFQGKMCIAAKNTCLRATIYGFMVLMKHYQMTTAINFSYGPALSGTKEYARYQLI